jgi:hypothetical protein
LNVGFCYYLRVLPVHQLRGKTSSASFFDFQLSIYYSPHYIGAARFNAVNNGNHLSDIICWHKKHFTTN